MRTIVILFWAIFLLAFVRLIYRIISFKRFLKLLSSPYLYGLAGSKSISVQELSSKFKMGLKVPFMRGSCFVNSCALFVLARLFGYEPELWIACSSSDPSVQPAHAWVEHGGLPLSAPAPSNFVRFDAPLISLGVR